MADVSVKKASAYAVTSASGAGEVVAGKANAYAVISASGAGDVVVNKANAYAVISNAGAGDTVVNKVNTYLVLTNDGRVGVTKATAYLILNPLGDTSVPSPFHESPRFPTRISYGSQGGPFRDNDIVELVSGEEERNVPWDQSLREFDVSYGIKNLEDIAEVAEFFEARRGTFYGFRYKDWVDYKSTTFFNAVNFTDQVIGVGDGTTVDFQLTKTYEPAGLDPYVRYIKKPVAGTVRIGINGSEQLSGWTVNTVTGLVTFDTPPGNGLNVTAGFEFDVPVRFKNRNLMINLANYQHGNVPSIELRELRS